MKHPNKKLGTALATRVPSREAELFKQVAYENELSVSDALRQLVSMYVQKQGKMSEDTNGAL